MRLWVDLVVQLFSCDASHWVSSQSMFRMPCFNALLSLVRPSGGCLRELWKISQYATGLKYNAFLHELDLLTHKLNSEEFWMETFTMCLKFCIDKPHKKCMFRTIARNSRSLDAYGKLFYQLHFKTTFFFLLILLVFLLRTPIVTSRPFLNLQLLLQLV